MDDRRYSFIGGDCPPGYRKVGTIDVADPADVSRAQDQGYRIGAIYDGGTYSCAEPCAADIYECIDDGLPIYALSVRQPWAWAIVHGGKDIENRSWSPMSGAAIRAMLAFRGEVCIHASKGMTRAEYDDAIALFEDNELASWPAPHELLRGGIIGTVEIVDAVRKSNSPWFFGSVGLVLANPRPIDFIPSTGALGFFKWQRNPDGSAEAPAKWMLPPGQRPETKAETADRQGALL